MNDIKTIISESAKDFENVVWPVIRDSLGGGRIVPVETVTDTIFAKEIDTLAGIDAWHILDNEMGMRGIASRVQWKRKEGIYAHGFGKIGYCTFTIRWETANGGKTEIHKRSYAIMSEPGEVLYPMWTVQAYLTEPEGEYLSGAIIHTEELIKLFNKATDLGFSEPLF